MSGKMWRDVCYRRARIRGTDGSGCRAQVGQDAGHRWARMRGRMGQYLVNDGSDFRGTIGQDA
jgi:hypothetical protein